MIKTDVKNNPTEFIENTKRWRSFDQTVQNVKQRHINRDVDDLQAEIDEACEAVRSEMWLQPAPKLTHRPAQTKDKNQARLG
jgi:Ribbon-helix-helix domain